MNQRWFTRSRIFVASVTTLIAGGGIAAFIFTKGHDSEDTNAPPAFTLSLKNSEEISFGDEELSFLTRIGYPQTQNLAYAAVDYQSGPSRRFRRSLDDLQEAYGENLAIIVLPDAASEEGRDIHRTLLTLHKADPRVHSQIESRLLDERIEATPSAVIDAAARSLGADRFQAVYGFHKDKLNDLMSRTSKAIKAASDEAYGAFPLLFAAEKVLVGFDGNPVRLETHIADSLKIRRLSDRPHRPVMQLDHETIDLGLVPAHSRVPVTLNFSNTGNEALAIKLVKAGPGARVVSLPETPVDPGEEDRIDLTISALIPGESLDRDILIGSNDGTGFRKVRLRGQAATAQISQTAGR